MLTFGVKGTRNLKQEDSSWATSGLMVEDWDLEPSKESRSEGVALGDVDGEDGLRKIGEHEEEDEME